VLTDGLAGFVPGSTWVRSGVILLVLRRPGSGL